MIKHYMKGFKITLTAMFFLSTNSYAANWVSASASNNGAEYSIDIQSLRRNASIVKGWVLIKHAEPKEVTKSFPKKEYITEKFFYAWDCANTKYALLKFIDYSESGESVDSGEDSNAKFSEVVPESIGEELLQKACAFSAPKQPDKKK